MCLIDFSTLPLKDVTSPLILGVGVIPDGISVPTCPELQDFATAAGATGKLGQAIRVPSPPDFSAPYVVLTGLGGIVPDSDSLEMLRQAAGNATRLMECEDVTISFPSTCEEESLATLEGAILGAYRFDRYRSQKKPRLASICLSGSPLATAGIERLQDLMAAIYQVRDLVNTSPNELYPTSMAQYLEKAVQDLPISIEIWDFEQLQEQGFGGLVAVGKGSQHHPCLVKLSYTPADSQAHVALVGKGITFDSGGYSLKPNASMLTMKSDMTGAATMAQVCILAAKRQLPLSVSAWVCLAENMVSGSASRVDDVITMKNGHTVEITNTDAEGRLVLADGLSMAVESHPDLLIDMATLTGAQIVALGERTAGVMGSQSPQYCQAASQAGESAWEMPLPEYLQEELESPIADLRNSGTKRAGGMSLAGLFLQNFVGEAPWVHVDIAGPSFPVAPAAVSSGWGLVRLPFKENLR